MINGIPVERYYFLLDWKCLNMNKFISVYGKRKLCELTTDELNKLYDNIKHSEIQKRTLEKVNSWLCPINPITQLMEFLYDTRKKNG